jgi:hypothetical protein
VDGGGGGNVAPPAPGWTNTYTVPNAPAWWQGRTYSGEDVNTNYAMMVNSLIPALSPEDQRTMATYLYSNFKDAFPEYNPEVNNFTAIPKINPELQEQFTSKNRAQGALNALDTMVTSGGKTPDKFGVGYTYLRNLLSTMKSFGGESSTNKQTRSQVVQQLSALDPLLTSAKGELAPFASIAQSLATPFFSSGKVVPITKSASGEYIFGDVNKRLY